MHPKVEAYIQEKEAKRRAVYEAKKQAFLMEEGLSEFVANPDQNIGYTNEYPCQQADPETGKNLYGKKIPLEITDEEYELLRAAAGKKDPCGINRVANVLEWIAWIVYIVVGLAAFVMLASGVLALALIYLVSGLISGTIFLGFAEIIKLLHQINGKLK